MGSGYLIIGFMIMVCLVIFVPALRLLHLSEKADEERMKGVPVKWQEY